MEKVSECSLKDLEFFAWNYWISLQEFQKPLLFESPDFRHAAQIAISQTEADLRSSLSLVGTFGLATGTRLVSISADQIDIDVLLESLIMASPIDATRVIAGAHFCRAVDATLAWGNELKQMIHQLDSDYTIQNQKKAQDKVLAILDQAG